MIRRLIFLGPNRRGYSQHAYQKTLNLPDTNFPKRSDIKISIEKLIPQCCEQVYVKQMDTFIRRVWEYDNPLQRGNFVKKHLFTLHDGPPYANGDLHLGHALNKILKDIINRYQLSRGKYVFYKPGWDCHGLPIELKALKDIAESKLESTAPSTIRSLASRHAKKAIETQKKQFKQFGIMTNWDDYYTTMSSKYELKQLTVFREMFSAGIIRRKNKPVYWGAETKTALAEGELEYNENHKSLAAYVKFPLTSESNLRFLEKLPKATMVEFFVEREANQSISCLIWTTTPWTLVANRAICYNEKLTYSLIQLKDDNVIVAKDLIDSLQMLGPHKVLAEFPSTLLEDLEYTNPLLRDGIPRPLLKADYVTSATGTGLVHNAPGHGSDDYLTGLKNKLEIFSPVDNTGRYKLEDIPKHLHDILSENGVPMKVSDLQTSAVILKTLTDIGMLHYSHHYVHSYPYDWRSKKPVIVRATPQWFADLQDVKDLALSSMKEIKFYPERGRTRLTSFIESRNEWCISRQRFWGVPIPAFYKKNEPEVALMTKETIEHIIKVIEKKGINAWFSEDQSDMEEWLPPSLKYQSKSYVRGKDTMDVWFDSGTSWNIVKDFYEDTLKLTDLPEPLSDVYLEGSDQHRGWFQSSLLTKVACSGTPKPPYKQVLTHGFTLDECGIKMSKSIGNTISPSAIINGDKKLRIPALGVDGLRYLVAQADFTTDIVAGKTVFNHAADSLKKFRLTFRFLLGNLKEGAFNILPLSDLRPVDRYTISKLQKLLDRAEQDYRDFNFSKILAAVQYHMTNELSAFYFDMSKDCLYSDAKDSRRRQQVQTTLFHIYDTYRAIMMPILPIMVQESWNYFPQQYFKEMERPESASFWPWPSYDIPKEVMKTFSKNEMVILGAFKTQLKLLGENINSPAQTVVHLVTDSQELPFTTDELKDILQCSKLEVHLNTHIEDSQSPLELKNGSKITLSVKKSLLEKCPRCWNYNVEGKDDLCVRCEDVVRKII